MTAKRLISFEEIAGTHPYFLDLSSRPDWSQVFANSHPLKLDIGFGAGSFLLEMAICQPDSNFVGIDMYHKGIRKIITRIDKLSIKNIRIVYGDAREKITAIFMDDEVREIFINFPDPWPKKRHTKRRLIKPHFVEMLASKLTPRGHLHLATDYEPYAQEILDCLETENRLKNQSGQQKFLAARENIPQSKYEKNFIRAGEKIFYLDYTKD
ncbi:MAG: tRNA (guanosine(46)-N7)-methyltransferase TrmB [Nitrospinota bacterium]|nr:tRNA (guanosine(46)-N7)-methyltransferase TrmB [Nitrospinota bacterium]